MKRFILLSCIFALALTACRKPEPGGLPDSGETTDTIVKKYLVRQLLNDDPERIMLDIEWNDDCSKILHVKHGLGYGSILDYDFTYYEDDSISVVFSMPQFSYPMWSFLYDSIMIHLQLDRIDSICCFNNGTIQHVEHYSYDDDGRIIERSFFVGAKDTFQWEGDNVLEACVMGHDYSFVQFTEYIHPHYYLPFYLSNYVAHEAPKPLFTPLWKNQFVSSTYSEIEADKDGYITKMIHKGFADSLNYFHSFYYKNAY